MATKLVTRKGVKYLVNETKLHTREDGSIQWMINFEQGWNSVWAKNQTEADKKAKKEYGKYGITSVTPMTPEGEKAAMSNFW